MIVSRELLRSWASERSCLLAASDILLSALPTATAAPSGEEVLFTLCDLEGAGIRESSSNEFNNRAGGKTAAP